MCYVDIMSVCFQIHACLRRWNTFLFSISYQILNIEKKVKKKQFKSNSGTAHHKTILKHYINVCSMK